MKPATFPSEPVAPLPPVVAEIGQIHFEGNIIPHSWYQQIMLESGKPDLPAIIILAEIIYWYRPYQTLTKGGNSLLRKHFDGDMFQCSAAYFEKKFGLTKTQARRAIARLEEAGLIRREFRDVIVQGIMRNNVMFIEPLPLAVLAITHPGVTAKTAPTRGETLSPVGDIFKGVEITTETTTEITTTTPNPSSSNGRSAEPEPARGGGSGDSAQNPNPERPESAGNHGNTAQEPTEEKTVSKEEFQSAVTTGHDNNPQPENPKTVFQDEESDGQPPKLIYPAKLTATEQQDIAAQLRPLLPDIAQQMLDVVESRMQSGQIRTNPAALLRGVIRKYQVDPDAFDPSSGFQIAETRRRRAEAAARLEAAHQASIRQLQEATPRKLSEIGRASLASMLNTLRGGEHDGKINFRNLTRSKARFFRISDSCIPPFSRRGPILAK